MASCEPVGVNRWETCTAVCVLSVAVTSTCAGDEPLLRIPRQEQLGPLTWPVARQTSPVARQAGIVVLHRAGSRDTVLVMGGGSDQVSFSRHHDVGPVFKVRRQ